MISDRPAVAPNFQQAIVGEALDFATKVMVLSDPQVQDEHERGLADIAAGNVVTLEDRRARFGLQARP